MKVKRNNILNILKVFQSTKKSKNSLINNTKKDNKDKYIHINMNIVYPTYGRNDIKKYPPMPAKLRDEYNFGTIYKMHQVEDSIPNIIIVDGVTYRNAEITPIKKNECKEIKAENNKIVFETMNYYQVDGHIVECVGDHLAMPISEIYAGRRDSEAEKKAMFWSLLGENNSGVDHYFSREEVNNILAKAGITEGFFSVKTGTGPEYTFYISNNPQGARIVTKERYDKDYSLYQVPFDFYSQYDYYEPGDKVLVGEKEYTLDENKRIYVPYGEDVEYVRTLNPRWASKKNNIQRVD